MRAVERGVCEDNQALFEAPPTQYTQCRDALGCDRLDHGYNIMADTAVVERAVREQVPFTMACWSGPDLESRAAAPAHQGDA